MEHETVQPRKPWMKPSTKSLTWIILIANISNLITGLSFAWSSPVLVKLNDTQGNPLGNPISPDQSDLIGSSFYIGACIGPLLIIWTLVRLGRKTTLVILGVPFFVAYVVLAFTTDIMLYYVCRIFLGFAVGGVVCAVPVYSSEILPARIRGRLMSLSNTSMQCGSLLAYVIGPYLSVTMFNAVIAFVSLISVVLFVIFCPESPYFNGKEKTGRLLRNLGLELDEIEATISEQQQEESYLAIFETKQNIKAFSLATIILLVQQFTGINIIIGYSQLIFLETNVIISSDKCAIVVGCFQLASSFITPLCSEKFSRKLMLGFSLSGLTACNFVISFYFFVLKDLNVASWLPLLTLALFVLFDNCGDGALPWVILGELYPTNIKSVGSSLSTSIFYLFQFFLTFIFSKISPKYMFFSFGCCCIVGIVFVYYFLPETKGKTLREIQEIIEKDSILV